MLRRVLVITACAAALPACGAPLESSGPTASAAELRGRVVFVVDGDTVHVQTAGRKEKVRLLGIDTPERDEPCFGEARDALRELADRHGVVLRTDPTQARRDRFGRLLAYVELPGGADLGLRMVRGGWARVFVFDRPFQRVRAYRRAERAARPRACD